jgi:tRNA(fMet)-specific endonuclease VapC
MILDTNALSATAEGVPAILRALSRADELLLPAIVLGEYRYGIAQSRHRVRYTRWLDSLIGDCTVLEVSEGTTHHYADINTELRHLGKPIPTNDVWIAALCRQHAVPLVSRDRHFDVVRAIQRIDW